MAQNKILPWAQTGTANVLSDADYASDVATGGLYGDGVKTGQASSKQANKTWRQATAPGSGLGQFLVDNLSVDVTDADTPATFSSRIANAVLKLAQISPFNQSWADATGGYRKYAIVSDSSGNFWVSTADQNVTVPGASGAEWQSLFNGYATQSWVNGSYVTGTAAGQNTSISNIQIANYASGNGGSSTYLQVTPYGASALAIPSIGYGNNIWQARGNYVASNANTSGTSGDLQITGAYYSNTVFSPYLVGYNSSGAATTYVLATQSWASGSFATLAQINSTNTILNTNTANLQNSINNKVDNATYSSDFATSDSRVINLAYGHRIQAFVVPNVVNSGDSEKYINFPTSFSGTPVAVIANTSGSGDMDVWTYNWSPTQFAINIPYDSTASGLPVSIIAIGPK